MNSKMRRYSKTEIMESLGITNWSVVVALFKNKSVDDMMTFLVTELTGPDELIDYWEDRSLCESIRAELYGL